MLHPRSRWICAETSDERVSQLAEEANISPLLARMMVVRGIDTAEQIHQFLYADVNHLHDPFLMAGMVEAVERIQRALKNGEKIRIYGDYDADGVSSTSLMIFLMRELKANFDYYIPHRANEGYGLNNGAIDDAKAQGCTLIVTVDTGISAVEQVAYAKELGIDVVITDHHEPPEQLPEAYALVNPKLPYCPYPFKGLAGVGVAFKLAHALIGEVPQQWLELVAIGTVADLMPLLGENRVILQEALNRMKRSQYAGIRALMTIGAIDPKDVTSTSIAFSMAPRINASGRLDHADIAVQLLTADDDETAIAYATELDRLNKERQKIVESIVKEAEVLLSEKMADTGEIPNVIVLAAEGWNVGVIGIVASKIVERYYRPTFVLGIDEESGLCKGSARSIAGFDLYEAMTDCAEVFEHFGGHQAAAGMTLHRDRLSALEESLNQMAADKLTEEDYIPCTEVDAECELADVPLEVIEQLDRLAPFGMGNPSPRVVIRNAVVRDKRTMGKEGQHLKLMLGKERATLDAVAFHKGALSHRIATDVQADVLGELSINEWNGQRKPQLMMQDIRITKRQLFDHRSTARPLESAIELARTLEQDEPQTSALLMTREQAGVYAAEPFVWLYSDELEGPTVIPSSWGWTADKSMLGNMSKHIHELVLCSIPPSEWELKRLAEQLPNVGRIYAILPRQPEGGRLFTPSRDRMGYAYTELKRIGSWNMEKSTQSSLAKRLRMNERELLMLMEVFKELDFITCTSSTHNTVYSIVQQPNRTSLEQSQRYQDWMTAAAWESRWYEPVTEELAAWLWSYWDEARYK
ncbi:single-stranded-DNA-specific exonuclease RecJ [Paenibacillus alvei]|uniref:single-stranded-DNA-specific exonuclease RecJ n=1 Tax=Paenibacillus alvei TaxID=44250 RepID=UPI000288D166|nr:single-stranded-DNA-specific exonuclease RecJ [Paenibacillus alvei]EJW17095.1 single-stranded-DNA-specific exonuclease RecJ [Paenibacillus alvei DSM 29]MCY9541550.1 single-stranded-DNA-specific exonuclease RecJ [Paenibacillus alvei]MCY9705232.1 single-stranded-DNA-specific exonuclease RecJ [Paenibacillus alvei]MCY9734960.1 single-stranded-DNA-specific exonuclease RecJ [Paenibacillus alvei]MCY9754297.1 single-stranded-DNA-specific exonuclease RecJ [Paenibacillus alvei]